MRFVWIVPISFFGGFVACATDAADAGDGGADDAPSSTQYDAGDATTDANNGPDNFVPFEATPLPDTGLDEPLPGPDANPCALLAPCDPQGAFNCPFFFFCKEVTADAAAFDAGDAGDGDAAVLAPPKGLCLPVIGMTECGDGTHHCNADAGERCFNGSSPQCLTTDQVACLCNDPVMGIVCGPP